MKRNLVRKSLFLAALFGAIIFAGCDHNNSVPDPTVVDTITAVSVVPATANTEAEPIETKEQFEAIAQDQLKAELSGVLSSITKILPTGSSSGTSYSVNNNSRAVTPAQLKESIAKIGDSFKVESSETSGSISGSWNAPRGQIDFGDDAAEGLTVSLDSLGLSVNAGYTVSGTQTDISMNVYGNASARYGVSAALDFSKEEDSCIKSGKFGSLVTMGLVGLNASVGPEVLGEMMAISDNPSAMDPESIIDSVASISGKVVAYEGMNSAFYFEVKDTDGKVYNGIIKYDLTATINCDISAETLTKLSGTITTLMSKMNSSNAGMPTADDLNAFDEIIDMNADFSVYSTTGEKLFSFFTASSFSNAYAEIMKLMTTTVED